MQIERIITEETRNSFVGDIIFLKFIPKILYGPFYRIGSNNFVRDFNNINRLKPNITYLLNHRTDRLRNFIKTSNINEAEKLIAISFIEQYHETIEMDADYKLLSVFRELFKNDDLKYKIDKCWKLKSPGRWCGLEKPQTVLDAHDKYYLPHLINDKLYINNNYLFEFYFIFRNHKFQDAGLFFGKTKNGSALQFKYNNSACYCITKLKFHGQLVLGNEIY